MADTHTIEIIEVAGNLRFSHTAVSGINQGIKNKNQAIKSRAKDKVQWTTLLGNFAVLFAPGDSPFAAGTETLSAKQGATTSARVAKDLPGATQTNAMTQAFKYSVAIVKPGVAPGGILKCEDPLLEIDDGGGGPGGTPPAAKSVSKKSATKRKAKGK